MMPSSTAVRGVVRALVIITLTVLPGVATAQKRPISHEDVWLSRRIGAPVVSPDGRWAALQVTEPAYEEREQVSDLWVVPTDNGAPPRRLTATRTGEAGAAWSPDGRRIAFSARRDGDEKKRAFEQRHRRA